MKLMIGLCSTVLSYAAAYLADPLGFMWSFLIGGIGAMIGVYVGWRLARHFGL